MKYQPNSLITLFSAWLLTCAPLYAVDSISFLQALTGKNPTPRTDVIHHSIKGNFAIRQGKWKLITCSGSGGWSKSKAVKAPKNAKNTPAVQLYNMETDIGEQNNLASTRPEITQRLRNLLDTQIKNGRTTAGATQKNDVPIVVIKKAKRKRGKNK